jgi:hypothetical protein
VTNVVPFPGQKPPKQWHHRRHLPKRCVALIRALLFFGFLLLAAMLWPH